MSFIITKRRGIWEGSNVCLHKNRIVMVDLSNLFWPILNYQRQLMMRKTNLTSVLEGTFSSGLNVFLISLALYILEPGT